MPSFCTFLNSIAQYVCPVYFAMPRHDQRALLGFCHQESLMIMNWTHILLKHTKKEMLCLDICWKMMAKIIGLCIHNFCRFWHTIKTASRYARCFDPLNISWLLSADVLYIYVSKADLNQLPGLFELGNLLFIHQQFYTKTKTLFLSQRLISLN